MLLAILIVCSVSIIASVVVLVIVTEQYSLLKKGYLIPMDKRMDCVYELISSINYKIKVSRDYNGDKEIAKALDQIRSTIKEYNTILKNEFQIETSVVATTKDVKRA